MDTDARNTDEAAAGSGEGTGVLDEALERLHLSGPEREGWLSNHAPMAVEALVRHGQAGAVHRWIDGYRDKLEDPPEPVEPVTDANWRAALGDPRRLADWAGYFGQLVAEQDWRDVLAAWWPRLLPGIAASATHPVIRTGHAVRALRAEGPGAGSAPRRAELAHALGYWAARHQPLPGIAALPGAPTAAEGLAAVPRVLDGSGGVRERLARITGLPARPGAGGGQGPDEARAVLVDLVRAATHRYATHAYGAPVMLVHAATAPNAVLRTLPSLPRALWEASVDAAWTAAAAVTAVYAPAEPADVHTTGLPPMEEVFARAAAHGDEHTIKFADTAWDVAAGAGGDPTAVAATLRAIELIEPMAAR
ncbi:hypothetical protein DEH18_19380 [Streptomyces sp. NHF165]|uniref:questin oxidase family protein n=1 Tax=Streptomyces sp. NHF165 TaxID=2175864 RepID=UPI00132F4116|nr:questin oxidase family protein [Streptomyces sp. NHF165]QHF95653.1 hypothetical protein DEH18_19380 [Streptomyces sp. NHF165]